MQIHIYIIILLYNFEYSKVFSLIHIIHVNQITRKKLNKEDGAKYILANGN